VTPDEDDEFRIVYEHLHNALDDVPARPREDRIGGGGGNHGLIGSGFWVNWPSLPKLGDPHARRYRVISRALNIFTWVFSLLVLYVLIFAQLKH
jgi:hypothetical protein